MVKWTVLDALDKRYERIATVIPEVIKLLDDDSDIYIAVSNHFSLPEKLRGRAARLLAKIGPKASDLNVQRNTRPLKSVGDWSMHSLQSIQILRCHVAYL